MTQSSLNPSNFVRRLPREKLLLLLETASECSSHRFLRQAALLWLSSYPGDLFVNYLLARGLLAEDKPLQARPILEKLCRLDPEFAAAQELLARIIAQSDPKASSFAQASAHVVGKAVLADPDMPAWLNLLRAARAAFNEKQYDQADLLAGQVLDEEPESVLGAILHIQLAAARRETQTVIDLAQTYRSRWPDCLQFSLLLAEAQLNTGDEAAAVILLHHCVVNDAAAQVPVHLWGEDFPYRPLWPDELEIGFDLPVPADIAARLGWNLLPAARHSPPADQMFTVVPQPQVDENDENVIRAVQHLRAEIPGEEEPVFPFIQSLLHHEEQQQPPDVVEFVGELVDEPVTPLEQPASAQETASSVSVSSAVPEVAAGQGFASLEPAVPTPANPQPQPHDASPHPKEPLTSVEEQFERLARRIKKPGLGHADGRYPIYVIFTTRAGLLAHYGANTLAVIEKEINRLAELVRRRAGWGAMVFCPDDSQCMDRLGLPVIAGTGDPWKLKLSLADLDRALGKKGQRIGAVLIVGGPEVIPFHKLPNPTDDNDTEIPSDNPYAALDSNYFVQDWPVGRLPGESGKDAGLLLEQIRQVIRYHTKSAPGGSAKGPIDFWERVQIFLNNRSGRQAAFGYTAAVWRRSSLAVYRQIGDAHSLLASPPQSSGTFHNGKHASLSLAYYNLHGLQDAAEWYGQRDQTDGAPGPDYPVAIAPKDISGKGAVPQIVFSEACYGAHINGKNEEQSLALKFLAQGTLAVIASTVVAYGSVTVPLIGADLLGNFFWKRLKAGCPVGEALMQAKVDLVREMNKRQGFLDGEDQKTLISFVLFGDPLVAVDGVASQPKTVLRQRTYPEVKTICERQEENGSTKPISGETLTQVKSMVAEYLPGIDKALVHVHHQHGSCDGKDHICPTSQMASSPRSKDAPNPGQTVVTLSNEVQVGPHLHHQFARVTLDSHGVMVKLAISR